MENPDILSEVTESFYLETHERLFFAVKGPEHPPDRFIAVLRYAPDPKGNRRGREIRYRRLYHSGEQEQVIRACYPQFLAYDPVFQTTLQSVPKSHILRVYDPRRRLETLAQSPRKPIERDAADFAARIIGETGVPRSSIGISGSLLIELDVEHSDLDLSVFGASACLRVYGALKTLLDRGSDRDLRRLNADALKGLYRERGSDAQMSFSDFAALERNKICQGHFRSRLYFIRFIREAGVTANTYGDFRYTPVGRAVITAVIAGDGDAIFTPCRYVLSDLQVVEGPAVQINEIVSFRGRFCEQARQGDRIKAAGLLERMENRLGEFRHRLLLGNSASDFMVRVPRVNR